ncbi:unnamed protein product [Cladocopium goreaui]|uniref:Uncharacterized protein n=1 Tax=Cladocopium goreaui TaxID=2562237 RepID=A0A9P1M6P9_9DINO|nr:unnamed protein product [Cladocopium goreaui]
MSSPSQSMTSPVSKAQLGASNILMEQQRIRIGVACDAEAWKELVKLLVEGALIKDQCVATTSLKIPEQEPRPKNSRKPDQPVPGSTPDSAGNAKSSLHLEAPAAPQSSSTSLPLPPKELRPIE